MGKKGRYSNNKYRWFRDQKRGQQYDPEKGTILVVSHEASSTSAPILALNICKELSNKYNIVVLILRGGELEEAFSKYCFKKLKSNQE